VIAGAREQSEKEGAMTRIIRRALVAAAIGGLALAAVASAYTLDSFSGKTSQGYKVLLNIYEGIQNNNHKLVPDPSA
jgi:hypothetical protein